MCIHTHRNRCVHVHRERQRQRCTSVYVHREREIGDSLLGFFFFHGSFRPTPTATALFLEGICWATVGRKSTPGK